MSKADRNRNESARQRIAAQQAAAKQAEARRRLLLAGVGVAVVILVVVGIILAKTLGKSSPSQAASPVTGTALPASVQADVSHVPASTLAAVGAGSVESGSFRAGSGPELTSGGKPEMLYIGAEWCPYCAAERWAMAVALSRFGTFSPLRGIHSSSTDVYPNTATLTFYKTHYTSKYLVFTPVENQTVDHAPLQNTTAQQQAVWVKFEPNASQRGYPFISIGNKFIATATYNPQVLQGLTWTKIAADLHTPSSPVAQGAVGSANVFTAAICKLTNNQPASVCTTAPVAQLESKL
jgi:thiol-disulfide isomerase/thioredoxin